jgi:AraC family transcriptional regulator
MSSQPKIYDDWKLSADIKLIGASADNGVLVSEINTPAMPDPVTAPLNPEEFVYLVKYWDNNVLLGYQHEENEQWSHQRLQPGQLMLFPREYYFVGLTNSNLQVISVALNRSTIAPLLNEYFIGDPHQLKLCLYFGIEDPHIHYLIREFEQVYANDALAMDCLGQTLGLYLFLNYSRHRANRVPGQYRLTPWQHRQLDDYIENHLDQKISIDDLATVLGTSRAHLTRIIKKTTGVAPHQYVMRKRIEQARNFLAQGQHTIAEVASLTGFSDQSHFNRTLRQLCGVTPSQLFRYKS